MCACAKGNREPQTCCPHERCRHLTLDRVQLFITLDLGIYSLVQGSAVAVFALQPGEGSITVINGNLRGCAAPRLAHIPVCTLSYCIKQADALGKEPR